jgi:hypothetical protein
MIRVRLGHDLSGCHVNQLWPKGKLWWSFITKATGFQLTVGVETWHVLIGMVG